MQKTCKIICLILCFILSMNGMAQVVIPDTLDAQKDTISQQDKAEKVYSKVKNFSQRNKIYNEIFHAIFRNVNTVPTEEKITEGTNIYKDYSGQYISSIHIVQLNVFDKGFDDKKNYEDYEHPPKGYSKLHINTSKKVIQKNIMFNVSDTINPHLISRNSKHLRDLSYIQDATIHLYKSGKDSVDVYVITKDRFPWDIIPIYLNYDKWRFRLRNNNIGGLGSDFNNTYLIDNNLDEKLMMTNLSMSFNNIKGSFINGDIGYNVANDYNTYFAGLNRPFIPFKVNWAGGINFSLNKQLETYTQVDSSITQTYTKRNSFDFWIGRQFQINKNKGFIFNSPLWLTPAVRISNLNYFERPNSYLSEYSFKNYYTILGSIGASSQKYYRVNYVNEFGRTEDIQQGIMAKLTGGYKKMEGLERNYGGVSLGYRRKTNKNGLCFLLFEFGTYFNKNIYSQGTLKAKASYMFPLIELGLEKLRNLIWVDYTIVTNRHEGEIIFLENPNLTHRVILSDLYGTEKLLAHMESNLFTSIDFYGFRVSAFAAFEFGYISFNEGLFMNDMVSALSLGFRVRNDFLIFNTIQFRFTFYSENLSKYVDTNFDVNEMKSLRNEDFSVGRPSIIDY